MIMNTPVKKEKLDLTLIDKPIVEKPEVEMQEITEEKIVPTQSMTYIIQTKDYSKFKLSVLDGINAEIGSIAVIKEWKTYIGKPSKYVPVALYERRLGGWFCLEDTIK